MSKSSIGDTTNAHERRKNFLNPDEMGKLLETAKRGRHGIRDYLLLPMMYRHGLRVSESVGLRRDHVRLKQARLWVTWSKNGLSDAIWQRVRTNCRGYSSPNAGSQ